VLGYLRYVYAKLGVIAVATTYYLVLVTFLTAYTHPARAVTVTIDTYDEAELELAFMLLSLPAAARFLLDNFKKYTKNTPAAEPPGAPRLDGLDAINLNTPPQPANQPTCSYGRPSRRNDPTDIQSLHTSN